MQERIMKKHKAEKRRSTATNSAPSRQVIHPERKGLTVVNHITFKLFCEMERIPPQVPADDTDNAWENWAALHRESAF